MPTNYTLVGPVKEMIQFNYPSLTYLCNSQMASYNNRTQCIQNKFHATKKQKGTKD